MKYIVKILTKKRVTFSCVWSRETVGNVGGPRTGTRWKKGCRLLKLKKKIARAKWALTVALSIIGASADKNYAFNWFLYLGSTISSCSLSGSPRDGQVSPVTCSLRGESRNAQTQFAKPNGGSAVWLSARAPIMHTKMAVITSLRFYIFQLLDKFFGAIFQKPPTFETTSRRSLEARPHPHQSERQSFWTNTRQFASSL